MSDPQAEGLGKAAGSVMLRQAERIAELEGALLQIKAICAGDRLPRWKEDAFTVTVTRGQIMDICEIADQK